MLNIFNAANSIKKKKKVDLENMNLKLSKNNKNIDKNHFLFRFLLFYLQDLWVCSDVSASLLPV